MKTYCLLHAFYAEGPCPQCEAMMCQNCGKRPSTENWGGTHDSVSLARNPNLAKRWCRRCVLTAQIDYMRPLVAKLPNLERELETLKDDQ